jgi:hypothetical protein
LDSIAVERRLLAAVKREFMEFLQKFEAGMAFAKKVPASSLYLRNSQEFSGAAEKGFVITGGAAFPSNIRKESRK